MTYFSFGALMKKPDRPTNPFQGVIIAALTPRRRNETSIDLGATLEMIDFLGKTGANAIALLGSTGEFVHFALDDRRHMTTFAVRRSRVPVLVNVSHSTLDGAVELAHEAAESGVGGLLLMPPYYFRYTQEAIRNFYIEFARANSGRLPIYLYNIPAFTNAIEISTALSLLDTGMFAGIKDSSGSWDYFVELQGHAGQRGFSVLIGDDRMFAKARRVGADGVVSGIASAVPELLLGIEQAIAANDLERILAFDSRLHEFADRISRFAAPVGIREAARQRKLNVGAPAIMPGEQESRDLDAFTVWFRPWFADLQHQYEALAKVRK